MLLYLVVGREIIDLDISPPRPTIKQQEFFWSFGNARWAIV
jgi:hypothetical protein